MLSELQESFNNAIQALKGQKIRSALTLLGIIIGIIAIVTLISVGNGINQAVTMQFEQMGSNTLVVVPGKGMYDTFFQTLGEKDVEIIENIRNVELVIPIYITVSPIQFFGETKSAMLIGINPNDQKGLSELGLINLDEGRELTSTDNYSAIIGKKLKEEFFEKPILIRHKITLNENDFRVIGSSGSASPIFGAIYDTSIIITETAIKRLYPELTPDRIIIKTTDSAKNKEVEERITLELTRAHGQEDFRIMSSETLIETSQEVLNLLQLVLLGIAAISLLVGGIGIMNTMFMNVMERTNEIGLMKAIGATKTQILTQFITEAAIIGLIGGTIGTITGISISYFISFIALQNNFELPIIIDLTVIFGGIIFAIIIGTISGAYPAFKASNMDAVDALRK